MPTQLARCKKLNASSLAAMRTNTGNFDHRTFWREARRAARSCESFRDSAGPCLADGAATFADQKDDRIAAGVMMPPSHKRVAISMRWTRLLCRRNSSAR